MERKDWKKNPYSRICTNTQKFSLAEILNSVLTQKCRQSLKQVPIMDLIHNVPEVYHLPARWKFNENLYGQHYDLKVGKMKIKSWTSSKAKWITSSFDFSCSLSIWRYWLLLAFLYWFPCLCFWIAVVDKSFLSRVAFIFSLIFMVDTDQEWKFSFVTFLMT